jgi:hypothetical protein
MKVFSKTKTIRCSLRFLVLFALIRLVNLSAAASEQVLIVGCYPVEYTVENGRGLIKERPNWHCIDRHEPKQYDTSQIVEFSCKYHKVIFGNTGSDASKYAATKWDDFASRHAQIFSTIVFDVRIAQHFVGIPCFGATYETEKLSHHNLFTILAPGAHVYVPVFEQVNNAKDLSSETDFVAFVDEIYKHFAESGLKLQSKYEDGVVTDILAPDRTADLITAHMNPGDLPILKAVLGNHPFYQGVLLKIPTTRFVLMNFVHQ